MHDGNLLRSPDGRYRLGFLLVSLLLLFAGMFAWFFSPIFPDEIAVRLLSGRFIQDDGLAQKLFYICPTNARETPLLFVIPAWLYSWLDLHLSAAEMRILPFLTTIGAIFLAIVYSAKGRNYLAALVATTALIGVSGSGLIIARAEYWQVLNVACCIWVFMHLEANSREAWKRKLLSILLLLSCLLSLYSHVQGLLFLPLSLYLVYISVGSDFGKKTTTLLLTMFLIFAALTTITFAKFSCDGYPGIEKYVTDKVITIEQMGFGRFTEWLATNTEKYSQSFYYKSSYQVNYLPGITVENAWVPILLKGLNQSIHIIVLLNLTILTGAVIFAGKFVVSTRFEKKQTDIPKEKAIAFVLFILPLLFLFIYDSDRNFYRSFAINLFAGISLAMLLSRINLGKFRYVAMMYSIVCVVVVCISIAINWSWFTTQFREGFEGPSISTNKNWEGIALGITSLAIDTGMDLSKGRIIVDDMTYDALKSYPHLFPVTYLDLSGSLTKLSSTEILSRVRPNYAIVRCDYLRSWGVSPQMIRDQFCAVNFLKAGSIE